MKVVNNAIRFTEDILKCDVWSYQYYKNGMICGIVFYRPTALDDTVLFWTTLFHEGISSLMHLKWWHINTLIPGDASLRQWTRSYLVYVIALITDPLFVATYLHKPMMAHCQMDQQEYTLMKFNHNTHFFFDENAFRNDVCKTSTMFSRLHCAKHTWWDWTLYQIICIGMDRKWNVWCRKYSGI